MFGLESWFRIVLRMWDALSERHIGLIAAGIAYYALLAVFPGIAALIALFGFLADPGVIEGQLGLLDELIPEDGLALLGSQVDRLTSANLSTLGWTTLISTVLTLWSARLGVGALIHGLNAAHATPTRGGLGHTLAAMAMTLILMGVTMVALGSIVLLPLILAYFELGGYSARVLSLVNWAVVIVVVVFGLSLMLRYGPNRRPRTRWFSAGLFLAMALWIVASAAFSWFMGNFDRYNEVYGSIAAVIALVIWFYISAFVTLLGGLLNAEIEWEHSAFGPSNKG